MSTRSRGGREPVLPLEEFVESFCEDHEREIEEVVRLIELARYIPPSNAFYFTVSAICNER